LGLKRETVSTQVIPRDRHAEFLSALALCGSSMERIAVELRHLQRSEVAEVLENFKKGQKGSSAMPHKRNPISSENLTGAARLLRSYSQAGLENVALWHERDISHSSVERVVFPDATILLDYALNRLTSVLGQLVVRSANVKENLKKAGSSVFSGHFLLDLVREGATREDAYAWVQQCALQSFETGQDFLSLMAVHPEIKKRLSPKQIRALGSLNHQLRNVPEIYRRSLSKA
jgi:adenylosuccinate lyase